MDTFVYHNNSCHQSQVNHSHNVTHSQHIATLPYPQMLSQTARYVDIDNYLHQLGLAVQQKCTALFLTLLGLKAACEASHRRLY